MSDRDIASIARSQLGLDIHVAAKNVAVTHEGRPLSRTTTVAVVLRSDGSGRLAVVDGDVVDDAAVVLEFARRMLDVGAGTHQPTEAEAAAIKRITLAAGGAS